MNKPVKMNRWIITGGCGFIGTRLIKKLVAKGTGFIRVLDNLSVGTRKDLARVCIYEELSPDSSAQHTDESHHGSGEPPVQLVIGDIKDYDTCLSCCRGVDIVVHLAANTGVGPSVENPRQDMEANIIGTFNLLEAARKQKVKRFIFASSGAPIGECIPPIHEELAPHPVSPYGASKLAGEAYCSVYFRTFGIQTVSLRFGNVYGPGSSRKNSVIAKFIKQALKNEICEIYGDGTQTRDFIYIDDIIRAIQIAANPPIQNYSGLISPSTASTFQSSALCSDHAFLPWGETFQIATSKEHTVMELAELLKAQLKQASGIMMQVKLGSSCPGDVKRNFSDTSKAQKVLGWKASVNLNDGLKRTVDWFLDTSI